MISILIGDANGGELEDPVGGYKNKAHHQFAYLQWI